MLLKDQSYQSGLMGTLLFQAFSFTRIEYNMSWQKAQIFFVGFLPTGAGYSCNLLYADEVF